MRGRKNLNRGSEETGINISPLIDMVFILLIFFIVTTVFVEEKGMAASTPDITPPETDEENDPVAFTVRANGQVIYKKKDSEPRDVGVNGVRAIVQPAMQNKLAPVTINVEPKAITDLVVRVMDEAYLGGAETVSMKEVNTEN